MEKNESQIDFFKNQCGDCKYLLNVLFATHPVELYVVHAGFCECNKSTRYGSCLALWTKACKHKVKREVKQ